MFKEYDVIALTAPISFDEVEHLPELSPLRKTKQGLLPGDVGTIIDIVEIQGKGTFHAVEFLVPDSYGYPVAITSVNPGKMRLATKKDFEKNRFSKYTAEIMESTQILKVLGEGDEMQEQ